MRIAALLLPAALSGCAVMSREGLSGLASLQRNDCFGAHTNRGWRAGADIDATSRHASLAVARAGPEWNEQGDQEAGADDDDNPKDVIVIGAAALLHRGVKVKRLAHEGMMP